MVLRGAIEMKYTQHTRSVNWMSAESILNLMRNKQREAVICTATAKHTRSCVLKRSTKCSLYANRMIIMDSLAYTYVYMYTPHTAHSQTTRANKRKMGEKN